MNRLYRIVFYGLALVAALSGVGLWRAPEFATYGPHWPVITALLLFLLILILMGGLLLVASIRFIRFVRLTQQIFRKNAYHCIQCGYSLTADASREIQDAPPAPSYTSRAKRLRIMFNGLAALSLLLCLIAMAARTVVPRLPQDTLMRRKFDTLSDQTRVEYNYGLTEDGLRYERSRELLPLMARPKNMLPNLAFDKYWFILYSGPADAEVFAVYSGRDVHFTQRIDGLFVTVPYWALALLFIVLPLVYLPTLLRRLIRRRDDQLCRKCGYDLRMTPDRCPECGTVPPKQECTLCGHSNGSWARNSVGSAGTPADRSPA